MPKWKKFFMEHQKPSHGCLSVAGKNNIRKASPNNQSWAINLLLFLFFRLLQSGDGKFIFYNKYQL